VRLDGRFGIFADHVLFAFSPSWNKVVLALRNSK
jgi:hypothetical protein